MKKIEIRNTIDNALDDIIADCGPETNREELIDRLDDANDDAFSEMVKYGSIAAYDVYDMVDTCAECADIIRFAEKYDWVEDDNGLWEGFTYGMLACIAYFSLRNCFYEMLSKRGIDSNEDLPFAGQ